MQDEKTKLNDILTMGFDISKSKDIDQLLDKVLDVINGESRVQFDPDMVKALLNCLDVLRNIRTRYPE